MRYRLDPLRPATEVTAPTSKQKQGALGHVSQKQLLLPIAKSTLNGARFAEALLLLVSKIYTQQVN